MKSSSVSLRYSGLKRRVRRNFSMPIKRVHAVAYESKQVSDRLNTAPLFWNSCLGALQTAAFIVLGRIFDQDSVHNLDRLLRMAQENSQIFSKAALAQRKHAGSGKRPEWLDDYLRTAYEPTPKDFRRLRTYVKRRRRIYEANYRDIRHKFFAHKVVSAPLRQHSCSAREATENYNNFLYSLVHCMTPCGSSFTTGVSPYFAHCAIQ